MKYKEVYLVLNQRKLDAPGFHYSDYSGWRAANQSYMTRQRPLWIVAEDPAAGRRMWICHDGSALSVTICKMIQKGITVASVIASPAKTARNWLQLCELFFR